MLDFCIFTPEFRKTNDKTQQILLQNTTANLLQNASGFFITKSDSYCKLRQIFYEMRQLLQKAKFITNCDSAIINPKSIYKKCHSREQKTAFNWRSSCLSCNLMKKLRCDLATCNIHNSIQIQVSLPSHSIFFLYIPVRKPLQNRQIVEEQLDM